MVKPAQQPMNKLQIYTIQRRMVKSVWSCDYIAERQSSLQKVKTFLIYSKVCWKIAYELCPLPRWWPVKIIKIDQQLSLSSVCAAINLVFEKDFTQSLWTTTKSRSLWKNTASSFKPSS